MEIFENQNKIGVNKSLLPYHNKKSAEICLVYLLIGFWLAHYKINSYPTPCPYNQPTLIAWGKARMSVYYCLSFVV